MKHDLKYRSPCKKKCCMSDVNETKQLYVTKRKDRRVLGVNYCNYIFLGNFAHFGH